MGWKVSYLLIYDSLNVNVGRLQPDMRLSYIGAVLCLRTTVILKQLIVCTQQLNWLQL